MNLFDQLFPSRNKPEPEVPEMIWFYTEGTPFGDSIPLPLLLRLDVHLIEAPVSLPPQIVIYKYTAYKQLYKRCFST